MKRFSSMRGTVVGAILLATVWLAIYLDTRLQPAPEQKPLVEIKNIQTLRTQFNRDTGKTRLILLLSPT
jgi:hypothetical protein